MSQKWKKKAQRNYSELKIILSVWVFPESEKYSIFNDKKKSENVWDFCLQRNDTIIKIFTD